MTDPNTPQWQRPPSSGDDAPTWHGAPGPHNPWGPSGTAATSGPPPAQPRRPRRRTGLVLAVVGVVLALTVVGVAAGMLFAGNGTSGTSSRSQSGASDSGRWPVGAAPVQQADASAPDWTATAAAASPSVVSIQVVSGQQQGQGSGVILDAQGHVVTNAHVVGASKPQIRVTLDDKRMYAADIVGTDASTDLAVLALQNPPKDLRPITMGDHDTLKVGSPVMAVGNPLGLAGTVTTGIVSALNRPVTTQQEGSVSADGTVVTNAIQTSAAINPGNSGGALVNASGQLVGINSSIAQTSQEGGNIGIGFAIPAGEVRSVSGQLLDSGTVKHPMLGVRGQEQAFVKEGNAQRAAAVVGEVSSGSAAAKAGLRTGDGIVAVDGETVDSWLSLVAQVREKNVGQTITLTVVRGAERVDLKATLTQAPAQSSS